MFTIVPKDVGVEETGQASDQMKDLKGIRRLSDF